MKSRDILNILKNLNIDKDIKGRDKNMQKKVLKLLSQEKIEVDLNKGISKFVIIPENEQYVIKIPYSTSYYADFKKYRNANSDQRFCWDYCFTDMITYRSAVQEGVEAFFCKTRLIGLVKGYPIYVQEKIVTYDYLYGEDRYEENQFKKGSLYLSQYIENQSEDSIVDINLMWLADAIDFYGNKKVNKLLNFINKNNIGDLHTENIGYTYESRPVIIDYSDFHD